MPCAQCALGFDHIVQARAGMAHRVAHRRQQAVVADVGRVFLAGAVEQEHQPAHGRFLGMAGQPARAIGARHHLAAPEHLEDRPHVAGGDLEGHPGNNRLDPGRTPGRDCPASRDDRATTGKGTGDSRAPSPAAARARQSRDARSGNRRQRPRDPRCRSNRSGDRPPTPRARGLLRLSQTGAIAGGGYCQSHEDPLISRFIPIRGMGDILRRAVRKSIAR